MSNSRSSPLNPFGSLGEANVFRLSAAASFRPPEEHKSTRPLFHSLALPRSLPATKRRNDGSSNQFRPAPQPNEQSNPEAN